MNFRAQILENLIGRLYAKMGIYQNNLTAIVIGDNVLPIIVIAQNIVHLSTTDIAFIIYCVITDISSQQTILYAHSVKLLSLRNEKNTRCP